MYGLKLLREDNGSLRDNGRLFYPEGKVVKARVSTPGIYISVSDGLTLGGWGPVIAVMEFTKRDILGKNSGIVRVKKARRLTTQEVAALPGGYVGEHQVTVLDGKAALVRVSGDLYALFAPVGAFPALKRIDGFLDAHCVRAGVFPVLESIGDNLYARGVQTGAFPALKTVGGDLYARDAQPWTFPVLESVGFNLDARGVQAGAFPVLTRVNGKPVKGD